VRSLLPGIPLVYSKHQRVQESYNFVRDDQSTFLILGYRLKFADKYRFTVAISISILASVVPV
jgi:hypothetical protein